MTRHHHAPNRHLTFVTRAFATGASWLREAPDNAAALPQEPGVR